MCFSDLKGQVHRLKLAYIVIYAGISYAIEIRVYLNTLILGADKYKYRENLI